MKKLITCAVFFCFSALTFAQDIAISFQPKVSGTIIDSIWVTNQRTTQKVKLLGNESLFLIKTTGVDLINDNQAEGYLYPNPCYGDATVSFSISRGQDVEFRIFNASGRLLIQKKQRLITGQHLFVLNFPIAGIYIITLLKDEGSLSFKAVCLGVKIQEGNIIYAGIKQFTSNRQKQLKSEETGKTLNFTQGDILHYSVFSNKNNTILTDSPTATKSYSIEFYECIDPDKNSYPVVKIGNQIWMAENLKATHYRNGSSVPQITDQSSWSSLSNGAWCYYNNDPEKKATYGRLYNWYAVNDTIGLAPEGWHIASDKDWLTLELAIGDVGNAGGNLKETGIKCWQSPNTSATNSFNFSALPGGYREGKQGLYKNIEKSAAFWCSTECNSDSSWMRIMKYDSGELTRLNGNKKNGMSVRCVKGVPNYNNNSIKKGYYLLQWVNSYYTSAFGCISTAKEADSIINVLKKHKVSGIEYGSAYFHPEDIAVCITVAKRFKQNGIDLWLKGGLQDQAHAFNNDVFPEQYRAYSMTPDGYIVPAYNRNVANQKVIAFDTMNPEAVGWLHNMYKQVFLKPLAPYTSGYFFDEECLYYAGDHESNSRIDYWELAAYSDAVLAAWQKYCVKNSVTYNNSVVTKFPVHSEAMVPNGGGKTQYFPGYNVPVFIDAGTPLISIPRNTGVWKAWDEFVTSQYVETWIGGLSRAVYETNLDNPDFKGVIYFGLHNWGLGYEEVTDPSFIVDSYNKWVPWGTQRGVQLAKICALPYVDHIICETFPPIRDNLNKFIDAYKQIATNYHKTFGVMLHRDDNWGLDGWDTEIDRWKAIDYFQPTIIARYPIYRLFPTDKYFDQTKENLFDERLLNYGH